MAYFDAPDPDRCPVCRSIRLKPFMAVEGRAYWRCRACEATFVAPAQWPDAATAKAEYDKHENAIDDPGYRQFLNRLAEPLLARLPAGSQGLDYGCGPGPALADMLEKKGHRVTCYDPLYADDEDALARTYDFITCTEVVEHLQDPAAEFETLDSLLRPGGWLGVMTEFQTDDSRFAKWHYRRDPTHIVFYRASTLRFLGGRLGLILQIPRKNVALFRKPQKPRK